MSKAQAESVIKNIIREITSECGTRGQAVSETLVAFMVKAVVLDPANEFSTEKTLTRDDVQKLIKACVDRLMDSKSSSLDTIKMQVFFDMNYTTRDDFLEEHRRVMESRLQPVIREITDSRARTSEELTSLYRKIVSAVLLRSGLGSPTDINVVREATAALQSVFPQTELGTFMAMTRRDKERHLAELTMIVTGIRLFNKDSGKGGDGIDDLPSFLNEGIPATTQNLDDEIHATLSAAYRYTAAIEKLCEERDKPRSQQAPPPKNPAAAAMITNPRTLQTLKDALINCRQHEAFLRVILRDVVRSAQQVEALMKQLDTRMQQLHDTVQSKTAVPTAQVYPQFVMLSDIWTGFQDEMVLLSVLTNILNNLDVFTKSARDPEEAVKSFLESAEVKTDEARILETSTKEERINPDDFRGMTWLFPETTKNFDRLTMQYKGFCGWSLVRYDRLLIPGNPSIGILHYKDMYFVFCNKVAAREFAENADAFIRAAADAARKNPELIQLLELHHQFATITPYSQQAGRDGGSLIERPIVKSEAGCQTDVHIMESNLVPSYEWNEWELRRRAIRLTNLRTKVTHSAQTDLSNWRRDNVAQVYLPKSQLTQTKEDGYTAVPQPSVFYAGLRGGETGKPTTAIKVDLTIPVEQQTLGNNNGEPS